MLTSEEAARRRRINKVLLPVVALIVIAIVMVIVSVSCSSGASETQTNPSTMRAAPDMTDEEFADFHERLGEIHPGLVDNGIRAHARDTCSSIDGRNVIPATMMRFSNLDHDVNEAEAKQIIGLIRDIGFCEQ